MSNMGMRAVVPAIAVVALLVGGCGSDDGGTTEAAPEPVTAAEGATEAAAEVPAFTAQDAMDVVEAIGQAYNTYDADLFMSVTSEDYQFVDERGTTDRATQASYFPELRAGGQKGKRTGDLVVISEDPFVISEDDVVTADYYPRKGRVGTSTYTLVVENGELKVQEHRWTGDLL